MHTPCILNTAMWMYMLAGSFSCYTLQLNVAIFKAEYLYQLIPHPGVLSLSLFLSLTHFLSLSPSPSPSLSPPLSLSPAVHLPTRPNSTKSGVRFSVHNSTHHVHILYRLPIVFYNVQKEFPDVCVSVLSLEVVCMCMYIYTVCERKGEGVQGERNKDTRLSVCLCYVPPPLL